VKPVVWFGDSRLRIRQFPDDARRVAGHELALVQAGREPSSWRPMPSVGLGVNELRVRTGDAFRVLYVAKFAEAVYVLHALQKKSRKTAKSDIELARQRYRAMIEERRKR
jgi:phage-related protein